MRFYDEITIKVQSGKWWDGTVTWRREAGVPLGWPSWGNGGNGWSIILQASKDENTLQAYRYKASFKASPGEPGRSKEQYWANAENLVLYVPIGTLVRDKATGNVLYAFSQDGEQWVAVQGGQWGVGNMHFKDAVHQYPSFCLLGEPGDTKEIILELQLLADVALIGTPSVGKTSLINSISNTKAKVADYPFTTLIPNLWSVTVQKTNFNVIDIPGLIKGAAEGKWLGNAFLRHILKARIFCLMADMSRYDNGISEIPELLEEIFAYIHNKLGGKDHKVDIEVKNDEGYITLYAYEAWALLVEKRLMFVINKYDLVNDDDIVKEYTTQLYTQILSFLKKHNLWTSITKELLQTHTFTISAATHYGVDDRLKKMVELLKKTTAQEVYHIENIEIAQPESVQEWITDISEQEKPVLISWDYITEMDAEYIHVRNIVDPEFAKLVWQLPRWNDEAEWWFRKQISQKWYMEQFESKGVQKGDVFKVMSPYYWLEARYIQY